MPKKTGTTKQKPSPKKGSRSSSRAAKVVNRLSYSAPEPVVKKATKKTAAHKSTSKKPPVHARSAYLLFCEKHRKQVTHDHPGEKLGETQKRLAELWNNIGKEEKKMFEAQSQADKARYQVQWAKFEKDHPEEAKKLKEKKKRSKKNKHHCSLPGNGGRGNP